uniref:Dishevelled-binding antagonist of beta-catenin 3a n=1 Tax=Oncorhynchus kisutch TaxID=8019 RepID=A0A8C7J0Y1_ONCKI
MYRAFSFPMTAERSRNKERLEASLAGLCELELLKQRQECLVLSALSLGDSVPGRPAWGDVQPAWPSSQPGSSLQCTPCGLMASLEQQVGELRMDTEDNAVEASTELMDIRPSSGNTTLASCQSSSQITAPVHSPSVNREFFVANREGQPESGSRPTVSLSFSAPYPSLEGIAEGAGKAWAWDHSSGPGGGLDVEGEPTEEDYRQAQRVETYILSLIQRRALSHRPCKPRTAITVARQSSLCCKDPLPPPPAASMPEHHHHQSAGPPPTEGPPASWACHSLDQEPYACIALLPNDSPLHHHHPHPHYPQPRPRQPLANTRSASLDSPCSIPPSQGPSSHEPDSPHPFHHGYPAPPPTRSPPSPDEQLVNAQYIPAQPLRAPTARASAHSHSHRGAPGGPKPSRGAYSPERGSQQQPAPQERERDKERERDRERERACRSQSENSLNGQRGVPERKYNTVERDGGGSGSGSGRGSQSKGKRPQPGSTGYRRWRSTLELSQDEAEQPPQPPPADQGSRRTRKPRPPPPPYAYINPHPHHHPHLEYLDRELATLCRPEERYPHPGQGESESSLSEDSPASSSLSSDSDESGGLVWPQQLPPQLSSPMTATAPAGAPLQPKAFVKIKASHALKKKILRFRTGSLKVMTTV